MIRKTALLQIVRTTALTGFALAVAGCSSIKGEDSGDRVLYRPNPATTVDPGDLAHLTDMAERNRSRIAALDDALVSINRKLGGGDADPVAEIAALKDANVSYRRDMAALEKKIAAVEAEIQALQGRLNAMEQIAEEALAQASATRALINRQAMKPLEEEGYDLSVGTGQVYAAHLASYRSKETARAGWEMMQSRFGSLFNGLSARIETLELPNTGGGYLRLLAGPFKDIPPVLALCDRLKEMDMFCQISSFSGEPLP